MKKIKSIVFLLLAGIFSHIYSMSHTLSTNNSKSINNNSELEQFIAEFKLAVYFVQLTDDQKYLLLKKIGTPSQDLEKVKHRLEVIGAAIAVVSITPEQEQELLIQQQLEALSPEQIDALEQKIKIMVQSSGLDKAEKELQQAAKNLKNGWHACDNTKLQFQHRNGLLSDFENTNRKVKNIHSLIKNKKELLIKQAFSETAKYKKILNNPNTKDPITRLEEETGIVYSEEKIN